MVNFLYITKNVQNETSTSIYEIMFAKEYLTNLAEIEINKKTSTEN